MTYKKYAFVLLLYGLGYFSFAQEKTEIKWWNPAQNDFPTVEGQVWIGEVESFYDRLPQRARGVVRDAVWNLSKHSAGLVIRFSTDASQIKVRYGLGGNLDMPHMPATGVSGVDLYAKNGEGEVYWLRGNRSFGDTTRYDFNQIDGKEKYHDKGREYQLYLPLYNSITWLEIGVPEGASFDPIPLRKEKPIVVYGTSIAQGACASRPGMAWTSILQRNMDRPLINLGFSGNGRMEDEVIDLLSEIEAKIFVLDCLPNLTPTKDRTIEEVEQRIKKSVRTLKEKRPNIPILLVEHSGYSDGGLIGERHAVYTKLNEVLRRSYADLKAEGITELFILQKSELNLGIDSYVDGTHPSDLGMLSHAQACERKIREILYEPIGTMSTTIPVTQRREPGLYEWETRHQDILQLNKTNPPKVCFFGNSITHYWAGMPKAPIARGEKSWKKHLAPLKVGNFGYGWDRIENVLWRIYHDELDGFEAEQVLVMLGTNNLGMNSNEEIIIGLESVMDAIKARQPHANIRMIGIYPRRGQEARVVKINLMIEQIADLNNVDYTDPGKSLLKDDGKIDESLFTDGLHPNEKGYDLLAPLIAGQLR
ncbi:SGNH/GDSL hydrolase family protein [Reichenbachiella sp. MALMAid0571]|uniref:SGNH/GDSL hydrolase family protein n=1 Tax=Reichenbachiella sp. MALMAid0571 TaxID=3143939 RepID=UPI0032DE3E50